MVIHLQFLMCFTGIDISGSSQPSTSQMIRLAANARFRDSAKKVMTELRGAGFDFSSAVRNLQRLLTIYLLPGQDAMDQLMQMSKGVGKKD